MIPRPRRDPEPVMIELHPIETEGDHAEGSSRPPTAGVGTLPSTTQILHRAIDRVRSTPPPRLGLDQHQIHPWPELRIHRLVRLALPETERALELVVVGSEPPAVRPPPSRHQSVAAISALPRLSHLVVRRPRSRDDLGVRVEAALHVHRHGRATPVEITVEPWSTSSSDLSLQVRAHRWGVHLPRRYFDVAHRVMDELWHQIEARAVA